MLTILAVAAIMVVVSFWRAHNRPGFDFNAFDLIMENGKVSKIAFAFMLVLGVSTWVIVTLAIKDKLTDGMFGLWLGAWVTPLVAKVVFNKTDMPPETGTVITTKIESTEKTTP